MKKSLIFIAIALITVSALFAADTTVYKGYDAAEATPYLNSSADGSTKAIDGKTDTELVLQASKSPIYRFGITEGAISGAVDYKTKEIVNTETITLSRNKDNNYKIDDVSSYDLTYIFYEYDKVELALSLSGDLKHDGKYKSDDASSYIPYTVTITGAKDKDAAGTEQDAVAGGSLSSSDTNTKYTVNYESTDKLGQMRYCSLPLTISTGDSEILKDKYAGKYTATITVTAKSTV